MSMIERLRRVNSPEREVKEILSRLEDAPVTDLDSLLRDYLCRIVRQKGPITIEMDGPNPGMLRWEEVVYNPIPGQQRRMVTLWIEEGA